MRNADWAVFNRVRADLREVLAQELADWFSGDRSPAREARIGGMATMLASLPYGSASRAEVLTVREAAHRINYRRRRPCACGARSRCAAGGLPALLEGWAVVETGLTREGDACWVWDERLNRLAIDVGDRGVVELSGELGTSQVLVRVAAREGPSSPGTLRHPRRPEGFLLEVVADPAGLAAATPPGWFRRWA